MDENCRGQHIGQQLYRYVLDYAKASGCYNVTLNVWACNENARKFYEKCGLVPAEDRDGKDTVIRETGGKYGIFYSDVFM